MKIRIGPAFIGTAIGSAIGICAGVVLFTYRPPAPTGPRPVCMVTHSQVVMIPTLCSKAQMCAMPIVAKVCDQIEIENPRGVNE